jgi:hypothetical protein
VVLNKTANNPKTNYGRELVKNEEWKTMEVAAKTGAARARVSRVHCPRNGINQSGY